MRLGEAMTRECHCCDAGDSLAKIAGIMAAEGVGAVPVGRGDSPAGMITDRDIVVHGLARGGDVMALTVADVMAAPGHSCFADQDCAEVAVQMAESQVQRMPFVNRDKRLRGMVSVGDLARESQHKATARAVEGIKHAVQTA